MLVHGCMCALVKGAHTRVHTHTHIHTHMRARACVRVCAAAGEFTEAKCHQGSITRLRLSWDEQLLVTASDDGSVFVHDVRDRDAKAAARREQVCACAYSCARACVHWLVNTCKHLSLPAFGCTRMRGIVEARLTHPDITPSEREGPWARAIQQAEGP